MSFYPLKSAKIIIDIDCKYFCTSKSLLAFEQKDGNTFSAGLSVCEWVLIKLPSGRRLQYYLKPDKRNESGFLSTFKSGTKQQQNDEVCRSKYY